ncbi:MAG: 30S ribosomal protein S16 [Verrucomicrobiota bacterium]
MATVIRLRREGTKDRPYYRVVVTDKRKRRDGRFIESLGTYDPMKEKDNATIDLERVDYWSSVGAKASETVASLIKKERKKAGAASEVAEG